MFFSVAVKETRYADLLPTEVPYLNSMALNAVVSSRQPIAEHYDLARRSKATLSRRDILQKGMLQCTLDHVDLTIDIYLYLKKWLYNIFRLLYVDCCQKVVAYLLCRYLLYGVFSSFVLSFEWLVKNRSCR